MEKRSHALASKNMKLLGREKTMEAHTKSSGKRKQARRDSKNK